MSEQQTPAPKKSSRLKKAIVSITILAAVAVAAFVYSPYSEQCATEQTTDSVSAVQADTQAVVTPVDTAKVDTAK